LELERKEKIIVGVNEFIEEGEKIDIPILRISPETESNQKKKLAEMKQSRNRELVKNSLKEIGKSAVDGCNLMPVFLKAARNYVTLGEMVGELKQHFGIYEETVVF
jgi:methylmalonyl-CoA mutase N-terminal domain/subunit